MNSIPSFLRLLLVQFLRNRCRVRSAAWVRGVCASGGSVGVCSRWVVAAFRRVVVSFCAFSNPRSDLFIIFPCPVAREWPLGVRTSEGCRTRKKKIVSKSRFELGLCSRLNLSFGGSSGWVLRLLFLTFFFSFCQSSYASFSLKVSDTPSSASYFRLVQLYADSTWQVTLTSGSANHWYYVPLMQSASFPNFRLQWYTSAGAFVSEAYFSVRSANDGHSLLVSSSGGFSDVGQSVSDGALLDLAVQNLACVSQVRDNVIQSYSWSPFFAGMCAAVPFACFYVLRRVVGIGSNTTNYDQ